jgi:5'-nucleotidase
VRILVTNDDGVDSQGLEVLAAISEVADVVVAAPDREYSGSSAALGALYRMHPEIHRLRLDGAPEAWAVTGPPALCVLFARLGAFGPPFDMVVAGINPGANVGRSVYHSGTVGAALTARNGRMTGVAVSQAVKDIGVEGQGWDEMIEEQCWSSAGAVASRVVGSLVEQRPPEPIVVNLNVPNRRTEDLVGWAYTSLGRTPREVGGVHLEPKAGHPGSYHVKMTWGDPVELPADSDGGAVQRGLVSVTLLAGVKEADPDVAPAIAAGLSDFLPAPNPNADRT